MVIDILPVLQRQTFNGTIGFDRDFDNACAIKAGKIRIQFFFERQKKRPLKKLNGTCNGFGPSTTPQGRFHAKRHHQRGR